MVIYGCRLLVLRFWGLGLEVQDFVCCGLRSDLNRSHERSDDDDSLFVDAGSWLFARTSMETARAATEKHPDARLRHLLRGQLLHIATVLTSMVRHVWMLWSLCSS